MSLNWSYKYKEAKNSGIAKKPYESLFYALLSGDTRNNDDYKILQYECAIRAHYSDLNKLAPHNGNNLNDTTQELVQRLEKNGFNVINYDHFYEDEKLIESPFISMSDLFLDYLFLEPLGKKRLTNLIEEKVESAQEDCTVPTQSNRTLTGNYHSIFAQIKPNENSKKAFVNLFGDVPSGKTRDKRNDIAEKITNMFYMYDQLNFFHVKLVKKEDIDLYLLSKYPSKKTILHWVSNVENAIKSYNTYL